MFMSRAGRRLIYLHNMLLFQLKQTEVICECGVLVPVAAVTESQTAFYA